MKPAAANANTSSIPSHILPRPRNAFPARVATFVFTAAFTDSTTPTPTPRSQTACTVAAPCDSLNVRVPVLSLTKRFSQQRDALGQIAFLNKGIRPDLLHQAVLRDNLTAAFNQRQQHLEDFWSERDDLLIAEQQPLSRVN